MTKKDEVVLKLQAGSIDVDEAMELFDLPATHVGDVEDLRVNNLDCGFESLNELDAFKKDAELVIFGARPGHGKTAFLLQTAAHVSSKANVLFFSLEMKKKALQRRLISGLEEIPAKRLRDGSVSNEKYQKAITKLKALNLYIDDSPKININELRSRAIDFHAKRPLSLIIVDYLQIVEAIGNSNIERVSQVAAGLKILAKELKIPVLAAVQVSRECEYRGKKMQVMTGKFGDYRPTLSDIADSSRIEKEADVVIFLSRQEVYDGSRPNQADIGVAKNRDGNTGWLKFKWSGALTKFYDQVFNDEEII